MKTDAGKAKKGAARKGAAKKAVRRRATVPAPRNEGVSMSSARDRLGDLVNRAVYTKEPVYLSRRGRRVAAVIDADALDRLIDLAEDAIDAAEADSARAELADGAAAVPWDEVKRDLGL